MAVNVQARARITLTPTTSGGLKEPLTQSPVGCLVRVGEQLLSCFLVLHKGQTLYPGTIGEVGIAFLDPDMARRALNSAPEFEILNDRVFASGTIIEVL